MIRHVGSINTQEVARVFGVHLQAFAPLFLLWLVVFFIFGLYEKHTVFQKKNLPKKIFKLQSLNSVVAVLYFYLFPTLGISPKLTLFIDLIITFVLILVWRLMVLHFWRSERKVNAIIIGRDEEVSVLQSEINSHPFYGLCALDFPEWGEDAMRAITDKKISVIIANPLSLDMRSDSGGLSSLVLGGIKVLDRRDVYEDILGRIPLSLISESWILRHITPSRRSYDLLKRAMDIIIAVPVFLVSLILYPFVAIAIKKEDNGSVFIHQERVGRGGKMIYITKFRSMSGNDTGHQFLKSNLSVTRVGRFLRLTRIDELPQLWNVIKGELSLVGPRPELLPLVSEYEKMIPFYGMRHVITPGLSGWAQIYHDDHPHHGTAVEETREKLSYDLYYIKNRNIFMDISIALKTIRTLLSRNGA